MSKAHAILFDLDGTLVDTSEDLATGVNLVREDHGLPPLTTPTVVGCVGNGLKTLMERALRDAPSPIDLEEACDGMRRHYMDHLLDTTRPYPGVLTALGQVSDKGYRLAVVTNKPERPAIEICRTLGLTEWITVVIGADSCPRKKPDPMPLIEALSRLDAGVDGSWMVGDNDTDLESGRRAGLGRCYCTYGFGDPRGETWDVIVDALPDFTAALPGWPRTALR